MAHARYCPPRSRSAVSRPLCCNVKLFAHLKFTWSRLSAICASGKGGRLRLPRGPGQAIATFVRSRLFLLEAASPQSGWRVTGRGRPPALHLRRSRSQRHGTVDPSVGLTHPSRPYFQGQALAGLDILRKRADLPCGTFAASDRSSSVTARSQAARDLDRSECERRARSTARSDTNPMASAENAHPRCRGRRDFAVQLIQHVFTCPSLSSAPTSAAPLPFEAQLPQAIWGDSPRRAQLRPAARRESPVGARLAVRSGGRSYRSGECHCATNSDHGNDDTLYNGEGSRVSDRESCKAWLAASLCIRQLDKKCRRKR